MQQPEAASAGQGAAVELPPSPSPLHSPTEISCRDAPFRSGAANPERQPLKEEAGPFLESNDLAP
jgi:hypothetical protein